MFSPSADVVTWHSHNDSVFALKRTATEGKLLCVFNFSGEQHASFDYFTGEYADILTGSIYEPVIGFDLEEYGVLFLVSHDYGPA